MCSLFALGVRPPYKALNFGNGSAILAATDASPPCSSVNYEDVFQSVSELSPLVSAGNTDVAGGFNVRSVVKEESTVVRKVSLNGYTTTVQERAFILSGVIDGQVQSIATSTTSVVAVSEFPSTEGVDARISVYPKHIMGEERRQYGAQLSTAVAALFAPTQSEGVPLRKDAFVDGGLLLLRLLDFMTDTIIARSSTETTSLSQYVNHPRIRRGMEAGEVNSALSSAFLMSVFAVASEEVVGVRFVEVEREQDGTSNSSSGVSTSEESWLWYSSLPPSEVQRRLYSYKRITVGFQLRSALSASRPLQMGIQPLKPLMDDHPQAGCALREMGHMGHVPSRDQQLLRMVMSSSPFSPPISSSLYDVFYDKYFAGLVGTGSYSDVFSLTGTRRQLMSFSGSDVGSASTVDSSSQVPSSSTTESTTGTFTPLTTSVASTAAPTTTQLPAATTMAPTADAGELPPTAVAMELYRAAYLSADGRSVVLYPVSSSAALKSSGVSSRSVSLGPVVGIARVVHGIVGGYLSPAMSLIMGLFFTCTNARIVSSAQATFGQDSCLSCFGDGSFDLAGLDPVGPLAVLAPFTSLLDDNDGGRFPTLSLGSFKGGYGSKVDDTVTSQDAERQTYVIKEAERLRAAASGVGMSLPTLRSRLLLQELINETITLRSTSGSCPAPVSRVKVLYFDPRNLQYVRGALVLTLVGYGGSALGWGLVAVALWVVRGRIGFRHNRLVQDVLRTVLGWPSVLFVYPMFFLVQGGISLSITTLHYYVLLGTFTDVSVASQGALYNSVRTFIPDDAPSTYFPASAPITAAFSTLSTLPDPWGCSEAAQTQSVQYASNTDNLLVDVALCFVQLVIAACLLGYILLTTVVAFPGYHSLTKLEKDLASVKPGAVVYVTMEEAAVHSRSLAKWVSRAEDDAPPPSLTVAPLHSLDANFLELAGQQPPAASTTTTDTLFSADGIWCAVPVTQIQMWGSGAECCSMLVSRHMLRKLLIDGGVARMAVGDKLLAKQSRWLQDAPIPQLTRSEAADLLSSGGHINPHYLRSGYFWEGSLFMSFMGAVIGGVLDGLILTVESKSLKRVPTVAVVFVWFLLLTGVPFVVAWRADQKWLTVVRMQLPLILSAGFCVVAALVYLVDVPVATAAVFVVGALYFIITYLYHIVVVVRRIALWGRWLSVRDRASPQADPPPLTSPCSSDGEGDPGEYPVFTLRDLLAATDMEEMLPFKEDI